MVMKEQSDREALENELEELHQLLGKTMLPRNQARLKKVLAEMIAELAKSTATEEPPGDAPQVQVEVDMEGKEGQNEPSSSSSSSANKKEETVTPPPASPAPPQVAAAQVAQTDADIQPPRRSVKTAIIPPAPKRRAIDYGWEQGEYNHPWVSIYAKLPGVGAVKDHVQCDFSERGFDLIVNDLEGTDYRLKKDNLHKEIIPSESKILVKKDKVILKLKKKKGDYSYDHWTDLTSSKPVTSSSSDGGGDGRGVGRDPTAGIMDMMKDMYDKGDDNIRKVIGESMLKARMGETSGPPKFDDPLPRFDDAKFGGGGGGFGDLGGLDNDDDDDFNL